MSRDNSNTSFMGKINSACSYTIVQNGAKHEDYHGIHYGRPILMCTTCMHLRLLHC